MPCSYDEFGRCYRYGRGPAGFIIPVRIGQKWGTLNGHFETITPVTYDQWVFDQMSKMVRVTVNGQMGLIDTLGKTIVPCSYDLIKLDNWPFINIVKDRKVGLLDRSGNVLARPDYEAIFQIDQSFEPGRRWFHILKDKRSGLMDATGKEVIPCAYDMIFFKKMGNIVAKKNGKYGLISSTDQQLISFNYDGLTEVRVGDATVRFYDAVLNGKHGLLTSNGQVLLNFDYAGINGDISVRNSFKGLVRVRKSSGAGLVTLQDKMISPFDYQQVYSYPNNYVVIDQHRKMGLLDQDGRSVLPCIYDGIQTGPGRDHFVLLKNNKISVITFEGNFIFTNAFDSFELLPAYHNYMIVAKDQKYGVLDQNAQLIYPCIYKSIKYVNKQLAFE